MWLKASVGIALSVPLFCLKFTLIDLCVACGMFLSIRVRIEAGKPDLHQAHDRHGPGCQGGHPAGGGPHPQGTTPGESDPKWQTHHMTKQILNHLQIQRVTVHTLYLNIYHL